MDLYCLQHTCTAVDVLLALPDTNFADCKVVLRLTQYDHNPTDRRQHQANTQLNSQRNAVGHTSQ